MFRLIWAVSTRIRYFLRRYMPTNILLDAIRTRRGLKWGVPAMLLAVPYFLAASIFTNLLADGSLGWLNLLVVLCCWNALKFIVVGPVSGYLLLRARVLAFGRSIHHTRNSCSSEPRSVRPTRRGRGRLDH